MSRLPALIRIAVVTGSALLSACQASVGTEPAKFGTSQPFQVGQSYKPYPDGALVVSFQSVDNDSRCPTSVTCVWAGSAQITLGVQMGTGPTVPTKLTWGTNNGANTTVAGGVKVTFDSLTPWPASAGASIAQSAYRAWLTFSKDASQ